LNLAGEWWVKPLNGAPASAEKPDDLAVVIAEAPAVYDPGGPVALVLAPPRPSQLASLEQWAASSQAAVVVVPSLHLRTLSLLTFAVKDLCWRRCGSPERRDRPPPAFRPRTRQRDGVLAHAQTLVTFSYWLQRRTKPGVVVPCYC
jgi:hypothetical protein